jgi:hypothetical protein
MADAGTPRDERDWLRAFLDANGGIAGSVHVVDGRELVLAAAHNLPPPVVAAVQRVPIGKGMAGLAFERAEPVQTCNLATDDTGQVRPLAKTVAAHAAVALPVVDSNGRVRAVVGIAFAAQGELPTERVGRLAAAAAALPG